MVFFVIYTFWMLTDGWMERKCDCDSAPHWSVCVKEQCVFDTRWSMNLILIQHADRFFFIVNLKSFGIERYSLTLRFIYSALFTFNLAIDEGILRANAWLREKSEIKRLSKRCHLSTAAMSPGRIQKKLSFVKFLFALLAINGWAKEPLFNPLCTPPITDFNQHHSITN